jgi:hypothetical protein
MIILGILVGILLIISVIVDSAPKTANGTLVIMVFVSIGCIFQGYRIFNATEEVNLWSWSLE